MIISSIAHIQRYVGLSQNLTIGLNYITQVNQETPDGVVSVAAGVRAIYSSYQTRLECGELFESHRKVIDIQLPLRGREHVQWSSRNEMEAATEYDLEKDVQFFNKPKSIIDLVTGDGVFAVFFPEDAHNPGLAAGGKPSMIKKLTMKISIES